MRSFKDLFALAKATRVIEGTDDVTLRLEKADFDAMSAALAKNVTWSALQPDPAVSGGALRLMDSVGTITVQVA